MQKITIVEDDPAMREELVLLLENEGYQVQAVTEFTEVVAQVRALARTWFCWIWACPAGMASPCVRTCGRPVGFPSSWSPAEIPRWMSCGP